jgi:formiminotetrahydrofolate cyclodeaminase
MTSTQSENQKQPYGPATPIGEFLDAAAARQPTPGGGSITSLVGALAASMGEMTLNYSVGRKGLEAYQAELKPALAELTRARRMLLELMIEDQAAFRAVSDARKLPETDPQRAPRFDAALLACIRIPQAMAATGVAMIELVDRITNFVNPYLLSDLAVCAELAMATVRCALYNVRVNLTDVKDPTDRTNLEKTSHEIITRATTLIQRVIPKIWHRHQQTST